MAGKAADGNDNNKNAERTFTTVAQRAETILENCNGFQTKQILAKEFDLPIQRFEKTLPQKDESVTVQINFSKDDFENIQQLKSLMSHVVHDGSLSKIFAILAKEKIQSRRGKYRTEKPKPNRSTDDLKEPTENHNSGQSGAGSVSQNLTPCLTVTQAHPPISKKSRRIYFSVHLRRELLAKADHRCQYQDSKGQRCSSNYQLQTDHIIPLALGGSNKVYNLRILCRAHNNSEARRHGLCRPTENFLPLR